MPNATPPVQPLRTRPHVRPLWERHELFREPQYEHGSPWNSEDDTDHEPDS